MLQELRSLNKATLELTKGFVPEEDGPGEVRSDGALATWWQQKTAGTTYWRAHVPAKHLPGNSFRLGYADLKTDSEGRVYVPRQEGASVWQFVGNATRALIMAHLQEQGCKVLMEVDDNYLTPPPTFPGAHRDWGHKLDRSPEDKYSFQAHRKIIRWVDGVIVATDELAERYARKTQAPIYHCPNSIDLDDWPTDPDPPGTAGTRTIGFAGSGSHRYDVTLVTRALDEASRAGATIYKLGSAAVQWGFAHSSFPWTDDLAEYRRNLGVLDVGLCPLKTGEWQDCKSDIKAMEYVLTGAVPIVSRVPPYKEWFDIVPSCETEKDWSRALKWAVSAPVDELEDVWRRAYQFILDNKLITQSIGRWREAIA